MPDVRNTTSKAKTIDSQEGQQELIDGASLVIAPPDHIKLTKDDMPFFDNVIAEFPRAVWTQHQIEIAAFLARCMCDMNREQIALRKEGAIMRSDKGTPVANPRKSLVQMHAGTISKYRLALGTGKVNDTSQRAVRSQKGKKIQEAAEAALNNPTPPTAAEAEAKEALIKMPTTGAAN